MKLCHEIIAPAKGVDDCAHKTFVRIDISHKDAIAHATSMAADAIPILFLPVASGDALTLHRNFARAIFDAGVSTCAIATDEDGALQKLLSPRSSAAPLAQRMAPLLKIFGELKKIMTTLMVVLTVEELAPAGIDASDGIAIANALADMGLNTVIATSGTKSFMPLYDRRTTQKKVSSTTEFYSREPALSSALWLINNTDLDVWCLSFIDDEKKALELAQEIGLKGLIKKSRL